MAFFDSWRRWAGALARRAGNIFGRRAEPGRVFVRALPGGRASQDTQDSLLGAAWMVQAPNDYESNWQLLNLSAKGFEQIEPARLLEMLADLSPEVSRALWDFLLMCNPGYTAKAFQPGTTEPHTQGQAALSAFIALLDDRSSTFGVIVARLFMGAFVRGAPCAELVLDRRGRRPLDIATPDPASIRFRLRSDPDRGEVWEPGQWQAGKFVSLERATFRYVPIHPFFGTPYGRPMAAPALFTTLFLLGLLHDLKRVIQQQGYPRLDLAIDTAKLVEMAPQMMSNAEAFNGFVTDLVRQVEQAYSALQATDAYIHTDVVTVNGPVGAVDGSLSGIDAIITALERMAVRALKTMPLMMGITEATGDVQSTRQWEIYAAGIKSVQHYVETILERLLGMALEAQGIQATAQFRFAELRAAEALRDAQTETMRIANASAKRDQGWITQDEASVEVTGTPAVSPAPVQSVTNPAIVQDNGDGNEQVRRLWASELNVAPFLAELREGKALVEEALAAMGER